MRCKTGELLGQATYTVATWRYFYPSCPKLNVLCSAMRGAYVPAITVKFPVPV